MKLSSAIRRYVEWKRFCGRSFVTEEQVLRGFLRFAGDVELSEVTKKQVFLYFEAREYESRHGRASTER